MEGRLVRLRGYEKSDLDAVMRWVNDEEVTQFLGPLMIYPLSSITEEKFIEASGLPSGDNRTFVIETLDTREYIGGLGLTAINWVDRSTGIGIVIGDKRFWGRGYGTDALKVLMRLAFDKMNLHRMWLRVFDFNQRAIACYEKCGFKREGVLRDDRFHRGRFHDTLLMAILEDEYRTLPH